MKLQWLHKVYSDGGHNAFTGMTFFQGHFLLAFRAATHHGYSEERGSSYGQHVLLISPDGEHWTPHQRTVFPAPASLPVDAVMDARDCYFLTVDREVRLYSFVVSPMLPDRSAFMIPSSSTVQTSRDGLNWSVPQSIYSGAVLWKPICFQEQFWCAGYRRDPAAGYVIEIYQSADGLNWTRGACIAGGTECFLQPLGDRMLRAFVRAEKPPYHLELWDSHAPFKTWRQSAIIPKIIQAPHVVNVHGKLLLLGREAPSYGRMPAPRQPWLCRTKIWELHDTEAREALELPSLGDTSYTGTAVRSDGILLVSYYSQHAQELDVPMETRGGNDKPADVFVAGVAV